MAMYTVYRYFTDIDLLRYIGGIAPCHRWLLIVLPPSPVPRTVTAIIRKGFVDRLHCR